MLIFERIHKRRKKDKLLYHIYYVGPSLILGRDENLHDKFEVLLKVVYN